MKALSTLISVLMLIGIVIAIIGLVTVFFTDLVSSIGQAGKRGVENEITKMTDCLAINNVKADSTGIKLYVQNCGDGVLRNVTIYLDDVPTAFSGPNITNPGQIGVFSLSSTCFGYQKSLLKVTNGYRTDTRWVSDSTLHYCIDANQSSIVLNGQTYLNLSGIAYLNDGQKTPYGSKSVSISLSQLDTGFAYPPEYVTTQPDGSFSILRGWSFGYLPPKAWWTVPYEYDWDTDLWTLGMSEIPLTTQPSWIFKTDSTEKQSNPVSLRITQNNVNDILINKNVEPIVVADNYVTFLITFDVNIINPSIQPSNTETWFGLSLTPRIGDSVSCSDTAFAKCYLSTGQINISTIGGAEYVYPDTQTVLNFSLDVQNPGSAPIFIRSFYDVYKHIGINWVRFMREYPSENMLKIGSGKTKPLFMNIIMSNLTSELNARFPGQPVTGEYMVRAYPAVPKWSESYGNRYFRFYINSNTSVSTLSANNYNTVAHVYWNFSQPLARGKYTFSFIANYTRLAGTDSHNVSAGHESLYFVTPTDNNLTKMYGHSLTTDPVNIPVGSSWIVPSNAYDIKIPDSSAAFPTSLETITNMQVESITNLGSSYRFHVVSNMYIMNYGADNVANISVYKRRGNLYTSGWSSKNGQFDYTFSKDNLAPNPGETRENYLMYRIGQGWNYVTPNITVYINGKGQQNMTYPSTPSSMDCIGTGCLYAFPRRATWADVTSFVGNDATFDVRMIGNSGSGGGVVNGGGPLIIQPWNYYTRTDALWQNVGSYKAVFETSQNRPYEKASYEITFTT